MKKFLLLLFIAMPSYALNLTGFWCENGAYKMARQDFYPGGISSNTLTKTWDGKTFHLFAGHNETVGGACYLLNGSGSNADNVTVTISGFSGPHGGSIFSTPVSSMNVTDYTTRPIEIFYVRYLQILGMSAQYWDPSEYDMRHTPLRFQTPYTLFSANDHAVADPDLRLWANRPDHDKDYPDIMVPYELVPSTGFTVAASSSQAVWFDVYVSTSLPPGIYNANITIKEGVVVSTVIPVDLKVYNFALPDDPSFKVMVYLSGENVNYRHYGTQNPGSGEPYQTTRNRYAQMLHRHKIAADIGDQNARYCNNVASHQPCPEYISRLNGTLFQPTSGYANGPGVGTGEPLYMIGTYLNWASSTTWSTSTVTNGGSTGFCDNVSAWQTWFKNNMPTKRAGLYLEDEVTDLHTNEKWATWIATAPSCQTSGFKANAFETQDLPNIATGAPHVDWTASTTWVSFTSATWQGWMDQYQTTGSTQAWAYGGHPPWTGADFAIEDDGVTQEVIMWTDFKKHMNGHFFWESTYWTDSNFTHQDTPVFTQAKTYGFDTYPTTDSIKGRTGFDYTNGDGVFMYPGKDTIFPSQSYGIDGPIASWRLKMVRRGIQDADYLTLANAVKPVIVTNLLSTMVPKALWEYNCPTLGDCSFVFGDRTWSRDPDTWDNARATLATILDPPPSVIDGGVSIKHAVIE